MVLEIAERQAVFMVRNKRVVRYHERWLLSALICLIPLVSYPALAADRPSNQHTLFGGRLVLENPVAACTGGCGIQVFGGNFLHTQMSDVLAVDGYTPPWNWEYGVRDDAGHSAGSFIVGAAISRRIATLFRSLDIEAEAGLAQRFGAGANASETWGAVYVRWHNFPWNSYLHTTVAVSTGLSYATEIDDIERERSNHGTSRLLHYFSPEITFAHPERQDWKLVLRLHHRSGGRDYGFGQSSSSIFGGVTGGAQYLTVGIKHQF